MTVIAVDHDGKLSYFADDRSSFVDRPFGCPLDTVLDIPVPPSVNKIRKLNKAALKEHEAWIVHTDKTLMGSGQYRAAKRTRKPEAPCEIKIILCKNQCKLDPDNPVKAAIDYLRRIELIKNDTGAFVRRIVVEWGEAPKGCRIVISEAA